MSRPNPARTLDEALAGMTWEVLPGRFALLGFLEPPQADDLLGLAPGPGQLVREGGETTLLIPRAGLEEALARHPSARVEDGLAWVGFRAAMGWDVVGFLARITSELAAAGVPLGVICGFSRDHLFVPERHLDRTREVLTRVLGREHGASHGPSSR